MLGIRKTLPWIARAAFWLFGTRGNQTLTDLTLAEPDGATRTLEQLTKGVYLDALGAFRRRVVAGATHGDVLCPYATSMLVTSSPNVEPQILNHTRMVGGHLDPAGHIPELDCQGRVLYLASARARPLPSVCDPATLHLDSSGLVYYLLCSALLLHHMYM